MSASRKPNLILRGLLKPLGLAVAIAVGLGILTESICTVIWWDDPSVEAYRRFTVLCVSYISFVFALYRLSPGLRAWLAGLRWSRRVSLWLFVGTVLLFCMAQRSVEACIGWVLIGLEESAVKLYIYEEPSGKPWVQISAWQPDETCWMPSLSVRGRFGITPVYGSLPMWLVGLAVLWPWWMPSVRWLLGGTVVRGGRPRRTWLYRISLGGLLLCGVVFWLSYQHISLPYGLLCFFEAEYGQVHWYHDTQNAAWPSPMPWSWSGHMSSLTYWRPHAQWGPQVYELALPMWIPTLSFLILLTISVFPRHRHRRRWERGLCLHCGYDLRGLTDRCTECGTPIEPERMGHLSGRDQSVADRGVPGGEAGRATN